MKRYIYPIELIRTGMLMLDIISIKQRGSEYPYNASRALILYTFELIEDGLLPINREYKPLGLSKNNDWVKYEDFRLLKIPIEMVDLEKLPFRGSKSHTGYLFNDGSFPRWADNKKKYKETVNAVFKGIFSKELQ